MAARRMRNHRHERFVLEYLVDLSPMHAAERAGYSPKTARQQGQALLKRPDIQEAIQEAMAERAKQAKRTNEDVLSDLERLTREALADGDRRSALKGLEMEMRHRAMFTDKVEHSGTIEHKIQGLSDADLDARIQQLLGKAGIGPVA